jgi:hypothetical protein
MTIEMVAIVGFVFAAATIAALLHKYHADFLHGPYIEELDRRSTVFKMRLSWAIAIADRFR